MPGQPLIEVMGQGPDLVLVHGWGMHRGVWGRTAGQLAASFRLHLVDLPGHGEASAQRLDSDLAGLAGAIADQVPQAAWMGWSLGGLVTLQALLDRPQHISKAVLVASNPSFVVRPHWPCGVAEDVFIDFASQLKKDFEGTLNRFLVLETLGSDTAKASLRQLKAELHGGPMPDVHALKAGLSILRDSDYTMALEDMPKDTLWIAGGRDRLVPQQAMRRAAQRSGGRFHRVAGAGHAPFIGHRQEFVTTVTGFLEEFPCR